jgi:hypothetical protein
VTADEYNAVFLELATAGIALGGTLAVLLAVVLGMLFVKVVTS